MNEKLNQYVRLILNEELRKVVGDYLKGFGEELYNCPASTAFHHAYRGGLVDHTAEMCKLGLFFLECPDFWGVNKDYLLASIILHDLGKIGRYEFRGEKIVHSSLENIKEHEWKAVNDLGDKLPEEVQRAILSHMGGWSETGFYPDDLLSAVVASVDLISSRLEGKFVA